MAAQLRQRRISYSLPPPNEPPPLLTLPPKLHPRRLGLSPLIWPSGATTNANLDNVLSATSPTPASTHPQHALGVTSLALDFGTTVVPPQADSNISYDELCPRGLLYSGGRDGLIISWDLGLDLVENDKHNYNNNNDHDKPFDNDFDNNTTTNNNTINFPSSSSSSKQQYEKDNHHTLPYEERWKINLEPNKDPSPPQTTFRQCIRSHTDWINDIALCNLNQTVISASSDHTVHAWNPHDTHASMSSTLLGFHSDYVKCLTVCRGQDWVASGSFDKQIKIWDLAEGRPGPVFDLPEPLKHSVYSIVTNPSGTVLAAGTPERVVRIWDPRTGKRLTNKLAGHTDNIRSLLLSEDGRKIISGSSDSTIKVWDLAMNRAIESYSYHSDSVWSLYSEHPNLDIFYSGDKVGTVCKVDTVNCHDALDGECLVLCKDPEGNGISKIVASSDSFLWTATNTSTIRCYKDVRPRNQRSSSSSCVYGHTPVISHQRKRAVSNADSSTCRSTPPTPSSVISENNAEESNSNVVNTDTSSNHINNERERHNVSFASDPSPTPDNFDQESFDTTGRHQQPTQHQPSSQPKSSSSYSASSSKSNRLSFTSSRPLLKRRQSQELPLASSPQSISQPLPSHASTSKPTINSVPFDSLVPLVPIDDPYAPTSILAQPHTIDDTITLHSMTSAISLYRQTSSSYNVNPDSFYSPTSRNRSYSIYSQLTENQQQQFQSQPRASISNDTPNIAHSLDLKSNTDLPIDDHEFRTAQREFELRETAADAIPLYEEPLSEILGRNGLIRSSLCNDRRHAITLDTAGNVEVWDIVLCKCIGRFDPIQLKKAIAEEEDDSNSTNGQNSKSLPDKGIGLTPCASDGKNFLDLVKARIEGEGTINNWCEIDTRTGGLTVHLTENICFDGEFYLDETDLVEDSQKKDDGRASLGRIMLKSLFDGFINSELESYGHAIPSSTSSTTSLSMVSVPRSKPPSLIPMPRVNGSASSSSDKGGSSVRTNAAAMTAIATPAETLAIPPGGVRKEGGMYREQQSSQSRATLSSSEYSHTGAEGGGSRSSTELNSNNNNNVNQNMDYFSYENGSQEEGSSENSNNNNNNNNNSKFYSQPSSNLSTPRPKTASSSQASLYPSSSIMGHVRPFTKASASSSQGEGVSDNGQGGGVTASASSEDGKTTANQPASAPAPGPPSSTVSSSHTPEKDRTKHEQLLSEILSKPLTPCRRPEIPTLDLPSNMMISVAQEHPQYQTWDIIYRGTVSSTSEDTECLEMLLPMWAIEYLLTGRAPQKDSFRLGFTLNPWRNPEEAGVKHLPSGNTRLAANRLLRVSKVVQYVADKINSSSQGTNTQPTTPTVPSAPPTPSVPSSSHVNLENELEILCNGYILPPKTSLAAIQRYVNKSGGDLPLLYRIKQGEGDDAKRIT